MEVIKLRLVTCTVVVFNSRKGLQMFFRSKFKKSAVALFATLALIGGSLAFAAPAQASPWNCPTSGSGNSRSTICYNGSGEYRVAIHCIAWTTASSTSRYVYGPWMSTNYMRPSVAWCEWWEYVGAAWAQTR